MSERRINLENIINNNSNLNTDEDGDRIYYLWEVKRAMKEACRQTLEAAAENAKTKIFYIHQDYVDYGIDNQSILNTINQIE